MSLVRRCDVCERIHGTYPNGDEKFASIEVRTVLSGMKNVYGEDEIDCCPECTKAVLDFVDILKKYPNRYCITVYDEDGQETTSC